MGGLVLVSGLVFGERLERRQSIEARGEDGPFACQLLPLSGVGHSSGCCGNWVLGGTAMPMALRMCVSTPDSTPCINLVQPPADVLLPCSWMTGVGLGRSHC